MYQCVCDVCACTSQSTAVSSQFSPSMGRALSWPVAMPWEAVNQFNGLWRPSLLWEVPSPRQGSWTKTEGRKRLGTWSKHGACIHFFLLLTMVVMWQSALTTLASLSMGCHLELWAGIYPCSPYIAFGEQQKWNQDPGGAANWPWESNSKQKGDTWFSGFVSQFSHV